MENNEKTYEIMNRFLKDKVFEFKPPIWEVPDVPISLEFKLTFLGDIELYSVGEPHTYTSVEVNVIDIYPEFFSVWFNDTKDRLSTASRVYSLTQQLIGYIHSVLIIFGVTNRISIERIVYNPKEKTGGEIGEQEGTTTSSGVGSGGGKNEVTTWSQIVGSKLVRGPANPITNQPRPDRVKRDGPANQIK